MNSRSFLTIILLSAAPSLLFAQPQPPAEPAVPGAPSGVMKPARRSVAPLPAIPAAPSELLETPQAPPSPKPAPGAYVAATAPAPPAPPRAPSQLINVQIEVALSDSKGATKTVMLTVADGELGQNRTGSDVLMMPGNSYKNFSFNADARPTISGNKVRLYLSAEAQIPALDGKAGSAANISLRQQQTLILNDGDSVEIARAADPVSERAFTLSVKVKIQR